uniref:Uncharacterized protein n=1 Tax=Molossus molossus TaxID=27622 RepID=A0A7J8DPT4_MOLMO|nr:hypothetical protein HJG59_009211 [Molossus molossus]
MASPRGDRLPRRCVHFLSLSCSEACLVSPGPEPSESYFSRSLSHPCLAVHRGSCVAGRLRLLPRVESQTDQHWGGGQLLSSHPSPCGISQTQQQQLPFTEQIPDCFLPFSRFRNKGSWPHL